MLSDERLREAAREMIPLFHQWHNVEPRLEEELVKVMKKLTEARVVGLPSGGVSTNAIAGGDQTIRGVKKS